MKKLITAVIALSMMLSAFAPCVFADDSMEKIIIDVKNRAGITDEYSDFSSDYYESDNMTVYQLGWSEDDDKKSVSVTYNTDDVITSYYVYDITEENTVDISIPKISMGDAQKAAQDFINKLNPNSIGEFVVDNKNNAASALSNDYMFPIVRQKNGIKINDSYGRINVQRNTGNVTSMYISYNHINSFADISNALSLDAAEQAYKEKLGLELVYLSYNDDKKIVMFPAYVEKDTNKYINAVTGEVYEPMNNAVALNNSKYQMTDAEAAMDAGAVSGGGLSRSEKIELEKIDGLISKEDIEKQVRNNSLLRITESLKLDSISLNRNYYDNNSYSYSMSFADEDNYVRVTADAKTGEIQNYYNYGDNRIYADSVTEEEIDEEKTKNDAEAIFSALAGNKKSEYEFTDVNGYFATYTRMVNGIKVQNDTVNITVDKDGKLSNYSMNYTTNTEFPSVDGAMSADEAADKMFDAVAYEMVYYPVWGEESRTTAEAVYKLSEFVRVNPFTGELVNYRNETNTNETKVYEYGDIDKHWAKEQITKLADYGIGFDSDKFNPDEKITERDFLYLLTKTFNPYRDFNNDEELYRAAVSYGYLSGKNDSSSSAAATAVTRETAAVMMIKAMGAEEFAKYEDIYVTPFKDVTENKGYIALLSAMKVVKGDTNGNFNPKNNMTRAEAACMIYNYLNR